MGAITNHDGLPMGADDSMKTRNAWLPMLLVSFLCTCQSVPGRTPEHTPESTTTTPERTATATTVATANAAHGEGVATKGTGADGGPGHAHAIGGGEHSQQAPGHGGGAGVANAQASSSRVDTGRSSSEIPPAGKEFNPPLPNASSLPSGTWYCDMGFVHWAQRDPGTKKCPRCGMDLVHKH